MEGVALSGVHGAASLLLVPWFEVQVTILAHAQAPQWWEWRVDSEGKSPWEGTQVAAFEVLSKIYQHHGDEVTANVAGTFP